MAASLHTAAHRELVTAVTALRHRAGLTQRQLAHALGREQNLVARIEKTMPAIFEGRGLWSADRS